jgi:hypothetical protein
MTFSEKQIYNNFLKTSKIHNKQPFKFRKNFETFDKEKLFLIKKLSIFFRKFPHISQEEYFKAPYEVYQDENYFPLDYFTSLKATRAYTLFIRKRDSLDPDNIDQLTNIKQSLKFIYIFCKQHNISPLSYINHMTNNEYSFILHLKEHKINIYTLLGYNDFERNLKKRDAQVVKFIIGDDLYNNISSLRTKFFNSKKALNLVTLGLKKISDFS